LPATSLASPVYAGASYPAVLPPRIVTLPVLQEEEKIKRIFGYVIDIIPALLLGMLNIVPIVGWMLNGFLSACYWLLRDITGASLGKTVMHSLVVSQDGSPSSTSQRIIRNLPFVIPGILGMIPILGLLFQIWAGVLVFVLEMTLFLFTSRRLGDRLAGTMVVRNI
jgi:uncharacterized RDD family membrane protein YckC